MDTCQRCLQGLNIPTIGREDLDMYETMEEDEYDIQDSQENEDT